MICNYYSAVGRLCRKCGTFHTSNPTIKEIMAIELAEKELVASPWQPVSDKTDLKLLGKLLEELGELTSVVSRCLIQGIDEVQPVTGKSNRLWLEEEFADVYANMMLVAHRFDLRPDFVYKRLHEKADYLRNWHEQA